MNKPFAFPAGRFKKVLCFLAVSSFVSLGLAQSYSLNILWTNVAGGFWSNPTNWSPNQVPGPGDDVYIITPGAYTVDLDTDTTIGSLTVGVSSGTNTQAFLTQGYELTVTNSPGDLSATVTINQKGEVQVGDGTGNGSLLVQGPNPSVSGGILKTFNAPALFETSLTLLSTGNLQVDVFSNTIFGAFTIDGTFTMAGKLTVGLEHGLASAGPVGTQFQVLYWPDTLSRHGGFSSPSTDTIEIGSGLHLLGFADDAGLHFVVAPDTNSSAYTTTNLADENALVNSNATFLITPLGQSPFTYQWYFNGIPISDGPIGDGAIYVGSTSNVLNVINVQSNEAGDYCVIVMDANSVSNTYCADLSAYSPETIGFQTGDQALSPGSSDEMSVSTCCNDTFQWRLNGQPINGATNSFFVISNALPQNAGTYDVVCANPVSAVTSTGMLVTVVTQSLAFADDFTNAGYAFGTNFIGAGSNTLATLEPGEPLPDGKPGGHSVWLNWSCPINGGVTISTTGSSFDTLLAVYTGSSVSNLTSIAADDDSGGFLTSQASFNAIAGTTYHIAVDGLAGATGNIVLSLSQSYLTVAPQILAQPSDIVVPAGSNATFSVVATNLSGQLTYQWLFNNWIAIKNATNSTLMVKNVTISNLGPYSVEIINTNGQVVDSLSARLEIGNPAYGHTYGKVADLLSGSADNSFVRSADASLSAGLFGSLSTSDFQSGAPQNALTTNIDGTSYYNSNYRFYAFDANANGICEVDTSNSQYSTCLQVYPETAGFVAPTLIAANVFAASGVTWPNNISWSRVTFPATSGVNYLIWVGALNQSGSTANQGVGNLTINWKFGVPPVATNSATILFPTMGTNLMLQTNNPAGQPTPSYQWQLNGVSITGATNANYITNNIRILQSGTYSVIVSNLMGIVTNTIATVYVQSPLSIQLMGTNFLLSGTLTQAYLLQRATNLNLPVWTPLETNNNLATLLLYTDAPAAGQQPKAFYELRSTPPP
ncbi:MAG TPA: immunoglobulin domain-containing protein [Verrucomicrobiae bacterium]|jgi:hypothetical protein